jgi:hypothetical protein
MVCKEKIMMKMKNILPIIFLLAFAGSAAAQDFNGQWKGTFVDKSSAFMSFGGESCEYVLELECEGTKVTGFSYTYFNERGKRYFTICRLKGVLNKASKYVEVTEVERTKTNVPMDIRNCFQIHKLTFFKQGNKEILQGSWIPAPNQEGDCGFGTTELNRRVMQQSFPSYNKATARATPRPVPNALPKNSNALPKKMPDLRDKNRISPPVVKNEPKPVVKEQPVLKKENTVPVETNKTAPKPVPPPVVKKDPAPATKIDSKFNQRDNSILKTIEVENETFRVDLYDNGEIDGDSISLSYNGKILLAHKRLTDKALTLTLSAVNDQQVNELVMYAENLGTIPPNTALMVVTDGDNRYEVRITSDTQKNGAIRFVHKPRTQ